MASTNVRLNGIIKTGQDSLSKETELVNELRKQIEARNKVNKYRYILKLENEKSNIGRY